jgi:hypothetical protein
VITSSEFPPICDRLFSRDDALSQFLNDFPEGHRLERITILRSNIIDELETYALIQMNVGLNFVRGLESSN